MIRGKFILSGDPACQQVYSIRQQVFVEEQNFSPETEIDEYDKMAVYALVMDDNGVPAATGRLYIDGDNRFTIGRVCVLRENRGQGMGDLVMRMLLYRALELNCTAVTVSAQLSAVRFYTRYGFKPWGEVYDDEGVPHRHMSAGRDEIDIEGGCSKGQACGFCDASCGDCARKP